MLGANLSTLNANAPLMFGTDDHAQMPESFRRDPAVWDAFIGRVWQAVLAGLCLPRDGVVVEVAPGSAAKIGHALAALGFAGDLHLVEPETAALEILCRKYAELLPKARLHRHALPLEAALAQLPLRPDGLLGSHVIDDLLLAAVPQGDTFGWASGYSDDISPPTRNAWAQLQDDDALLHDAQEQAAAIIAAALLYLMPRHAVFSQYPSATLQDGGLQGLNDAAARLLRGLPGRLGGYDCKAPAGALSLLPHYHNPHIGLHVLNPQYWLSCTRKT